MIFTIFDQVKISNEYPIVYLIWNEPGAIFN